MSNYTGLTKMSFWLITTLMVLCVQLSGANKPLDNCMNVGGESETKIVCVCSEQSCDDLVSRWPEEQGEAFLISSSEAGDRFRERALNSAGEPNGMEAADVEIDLNTEHQSILGWGGAFTDATGINIQSLSTKLADKLIESYYGQGGLQYNFGRVPIAGSDFSTRPYTYDDSDEPDYELKKWSLAKEDSDYKIPVIKQAIEAMAKYTNSSLKLFGSPWSPPTWMKDNHNITRGHLIDRAEVYQSYADYFVKFFNAYRAHGIDFWGTTVQNEPMEATSPSYYFNSLELINNQAIKFIGDYLGPTLAASGYGKDKFKLMVGDDPLGSLNKQIPEIVFDEKVKKYTSGVAFHWYRSNRSSPYDDINRAVDPILKNIEFVLMTEACTGWSPDEKHVDMGNWTRGELYANDIIEDMLRHSAGWIDWNMALDLQGGPNWVQNYVDSPILVDKKNNQFFKQPMYYALGHFSRLFKPDSIRVESRLSKADENQSGDLKVVAVHNKQTGHLVVNILNRSHDSKGIRVAVKGAKNKIPTFLIDARSINSIIFKL